MGDELQVMPAKSYLEYHFIEVYRVAVMMLVLPQSAESLTDRILFRDLNPSADKATMRLYRQATMLN